ncbi:hypothetical protein ACFP1Z_14100 [Streptomyces gamaensis]|uniref:Uncharacterized protein n=1 Tax=Streptomyces gamaensis TaxID=1763542 RepID=A0ABW0Z3Z1_9ACTN
MNSTRPSDNIPSRPTEVAHPADLTHWCLRCAELRLRYRTATRLGRYAEAETLDLEFARHQRMVHA